MKYVAAALLLQLGNSQTISKSGVTELLKSVGIEADQDRLNAFMSKVEGKDINELINAGLGKMATFSIGSGGGAAPAPSEQAGEAAEVKEEAKEEEKEESDGDFGFGLFD